MKKLFYLILFNCIFSLTIFAQTEIITVLETVKIKDDKRAEALFYFQNNWKVLRKNALEKGYIHSFELIETKAEKNSDFDIILITRYINQTQYDKSEENFQKLIAESGGLKLKNEMKPNDFKQNIFVKIGKSLFVTHTNK